MQLSTVPQYLKSYLSRGPSYVILYVTSRCNQKCEFCFYADSLNAPWKDGLSLDEIRKIARSIAPCIHVTLTGGEPFLRRDLDEVVSAMIEEGGVRNVTIPTNGSFPDRVEQVVSSVCERYPHVELRVALSLDALGEKHDRLRGMPGAFAKATDTHRRVRRLQARHPNLHLLVTSVASKFNKDDLREFFDHAFTELPSDDHALLLARGDTKNPDARDITPAEYRELSAYLDAKLKARTSSANGGHGRLLERIEQVVRHEAGALHRGAAPRYTCVAGGKFLVIYDSGDVYPCEIIETEKPRHAEALKRFGGTFKIGNVRDCAHDVGALVRGERAREIRQYIEDSRCHCTFECAIAASVVFKPTSLVRALASGVSERKG